MSVTFTAATTTPDAVRVFKLTCEVTGVMGEWTGYGNAYSEAHAHALVCVNNLCRDYGADVDEVTDLPVEINMANGNARRVLDVLGIPVDDDDMYGEEDAAVFLGRVLLALALAPHDEGMPAYAMQSGEGLFRGGRQIHCGREAGDLQRRLERLREFAEDCRARSLTIQWS